MKNWLILLLFTPALVFAQIEDSSSSPTKNETSDITWVDTSHAYATDKTQALTEWLDAFFGDPLYDEKRAESFLRLELIEDWDQEDGSSTKVRLRGQVQLPKISQRVHLVFAGEDSKDLTQDERDLEDRIGLRFNLNDSDRHQFDVTMNYSSGQLKPGIRYQNEAKISDLYSYRFNQRVQYQKDEQFILTTRADLNRALGKDAEWRWSNRLVTGGRTDGVEWRTRLTLRQRYLGDTEKPIAMSYFGSINGVTQPDRFVVNYQLGLLFRRQVYREFLFVELEPAYNYRRRQLEFDREGQWSLILRLEIALERDLRRVKIEAEQ